MRLSTLGRVVLPGLFSFISLALCGQSFFNTGLNNTVFNLPCNKTCLDIPVHIPHIKGTSEYIVTSIDYLPYDYVTPGGTEDPVLYDDDKFSFATTLPFNFCFYETSFNKVVVGSNGLITFDETNASCDNSWVITNPIPFAGGTQCLAGNTYIPKASILGAYSDLDPRSKGIPGPGADNASPADRKIEWRIEGAAPNRRFIASFYHIGVYNSSDNTCSIATPNTFQIVLYETTGIIEIYVDQKSCASETNGGRAIMGIQNFARNKAVTPPGKNNTVWTETKKAYRFTPSGSVTRYVSSEIRTLAGVFVAIGDTTTTTPGVLDVNFPPNSICPANPSEKYVITTVFSDCNNPGTLITNHDTITVVKTNGFNTTKVVTPTTCGTTGTGSVTLTRQPNIGTGPYTYQLMPNNISQTDNGIFTGLAAGNYTVNISDATGCSEVVPFTITSTGELPLTFTVTNTSCVGPSNGGFIVNPTNGTAPFQYTVASTLLPTPITAVTPTFTNLAAGTYFVTVRDGAGCEVIDKTVVVGSGPSMVVNYTATAPSCFGAHNGSALLMPEGTAPYKDTISGGPTTNPIVGLTGGFAYPVIVTDAIGCKTSLLVIIPNGTGTVTGSATSVPTACAGVNNGSITVTPTSGSAPYEYSINGGTNWQPSPVFNGLAPGSYNNILIRSSGICMSNNIAATVSAGTGVLATVTNTPTTCAGVNNGSITVTPTNGTAPYAITLDGTTTQPGFTFNGVSAGAHTITIKDANGCVTTTAIPTTVAAGSGYTTGFTATPTSCVGVNNGSVLITPQLPGSSPYTFVLNPGAVSQTGAANTTFNGLAPATYSVTVTDGNGCQSTANNIVITQGAGLLGTLTPSSTTCAAASNGSIVVAANSGTGPYSITLDGTRTQSGPAGTTFINVGAGAHSVMITDINGCTTASPLTTTVAAGTGYTTNFTVTPTSCVGVNNGSITVTPQSPATSPYTFVMSPGVVSQTGAANTTFNGLSPATYSVLVTDANGCQSTAGNIVVAQGAGLSGTLTSSATTCAGVSNGTITVTPGSGTGPYTMLLDGTKTQSGATNTIFTGLAAGSHSVVITDINGCTTTTPLTTTITSGTGYTTDFTVTGTTCLGVNNGSLTVTPQSPATSPYTFILTPGGVSQTGAANTIFTGLAPGTYSVAVTDNNGCQSTASNMVITQGAGLLANSAAANATCFGAANGSITVTPSNGTGPYTFVMNPGTITQSGATATTFTNLAANTYTIMMTDAAGCSIVSPVVKTITQPTALTAPLPAALPVTCNGASNGTITVFPVGGTPPYTYSLDNITFQNTGTFSVPQGTYTVFVKDANNCTLQFNNILITQPAQLSAAVNSTVNGTCNGGDDGSIQVTPTGGTAPYQYSLNGIDFQPSNTLNVAPGTYSVTVKDANSCTFVIPGIVVGMTDNLTLTMTDPPAICEGTGVELKPVTNANGFTWTYTGAASLSETDTGNPVASPKTTTTYTLTATLGGCTRMGSMTVSVLPAPVPVAGGTGDICYGQNFQLQGSGGVSYTWSPATYLNNPGIEDPQSVKPEHTITYSLTVTDANNCKSVVPASVTVNVTPPIKVTSSFSDTVVYAGAKFRLQVASVGTDYVWTPATGLDNPFVPNPIVTAPATGDEVRYKVVSTTSAGCKGEKYITIRVYKGPEIYVVDAFTPNNDGKNEVFIPFPVGIKELKYFRVFNRWGQLLFNTTTLNKGWDGRFAGAEQASGVYIWMIQGVTENGAIINKKGTVTLIR